MAKLSEITLEAYRKLIHHQEFVRKQGGFWTAESTRIVSKHGSPEWWFGAGTIKLLVKQKMARYIEFDGFGNPIRIGINGL